MSPTGLPVEDVVPQVRAALREAGHAVLQAPPGAGKTTVVPLRLLDEPWLGDGRIVVLEPRRLAARAAAARMAHLLGESVGATVGLVTRDERKVGAGTRIEVVTEGVLTRRLQRDPALEGTALVVLDEWHERSLQADLALALLLDTRGVLRPDIKVLAMSATIAAERVAAVLGGDGPPAPVVVSEGRTHPVDVRWIAARPHERVERATANAVHRALREEAGDLLVFLPGAGAIRRVQADLEGSVASTVDVRPLFGALSTAEQDAALAASPAGRRRVVLSTDIAETSLTVPGVRVVVDAGLARSPRADARTGLTRLHTGPISRASADQRSGRAGRTEPGVAYRLWTKGEHATRPAFAPAEILSVDLTGLALELAVWGTDPADLAFLDPPPDRAMAEARRLLLTLGALDAAGRPTDRGRAMSDLPLHPRLARMVHDAAAEGHGWEACALAALLEDRDVLRGHPDSLPTDVSGRLALVGGGDERHHTGDAPVDRGALAGARRRATQLARRARVAQGAMDTDAAGRVLALAYPDRVAQRRGRNRVRLRGGSAAWFPDGDPLATEELVVVAAMDAGRGGEARVRMAAALDAADVEAATGAEVARVETVAWDDQRDDLRRRTELRLDALVLGGTEGPARPGPATVAALVGRARATDLVVLGWTDAAWALQARVAFATRVRPDLDWPDLSHPGLLAALDDWLAPLLAGASGRSDLARVDLVNAWRSQLGHALGSELDRLAPRTVRLAGPRDLAVDYAGDAPTIAVRTQDAYGTTVHPTVGGGAVPVTVQLLSPAGRPIQVTADLPGFWAGSWAAVRREMVGRYPKHDWPADPATARPGGRPRRAR